VRITTLIEDTIEGNKGNLVSEHGLSLHISFSGKGILFDTGISDAFSKNADALGIDLKAIQAVILSHHHYDHGGGLSRFFELNPEAKVYLKKTPRGDCCFKALLLLRKYIGTDKHLFEINPHRFIFIKEFTEIMPDVYIFTSIVSAYPKPRGNRYLYVKRNAKWYLDDFDHELIMAIKEDGKLIIFTGCSHNGVLNMIETVAKRFDGVPIKAVIGGFHLIGLPMFNTMAESRSKVKGIAREILSYQVQHIHTGHCTGQKAYKVLKDVIGENLKHLYTGNIIEI
jgi:7,8-dihydropterin-6-yl-methyl-4-(beta-D-ribofuranosyl)aminobenzene 5'-phosphate synthase